MYIKNIKLKNFRNYTNQEIELNKNINIFFGDNAQGKTNIIESIYISSIGKSFRAKKDIEIVNIENKNESAIIEIEYQKEDRDGKIKIEIKENKNIFINGIKAKKLSEILGNINIVLFSPDDINLFKSGPAKRRKALDIMISQLRPAYIYNLNLYLKTIEQRNNYLRQIKYENQNPSMLDIWDEQLSEYSYKIFEYRNYFINKISEKIEVFHNLITKSGKEDIKIKYISNSKDKKSFLENLKKSREIDLKRGFTATGVHRDDFMIYINNRPVAIFGSQGQQRTSILTLKLCELQIVKDELGENPILLLDDFMSELDSQRRKSFLENISGNQVIITCTDKIDLENESSKFFVEKGICKKVE